MPEREQKKTRENAILRFENFVRNSLRRVQKIGTIWFEFGQNFLKNRPFYNHTVACARVRAPCLMHLDARKCRWNRGKIALLSRHKIGVVTTGILLYVLLYVLLRVFCYMFRYMFCCMFCCVFFVIYFVICFVVCFAVLMFSIN